MKYSPFRLSLRHWLDWLKLWMKRCEEIGTSIKQKWNLLQFAHEKKKLQYTRIYIKKYRLYKEIPKNFLSFVISFSFSQQTYLAFSLFFLLLSLETSFPSQPLEIVWYQRKEYWFPKDIKTKIMKQANDSCINLVCIMFYKE